MKKAFSAMIFAAALLFALSAYAAGMHGKQFSIPAGDEFPAFTAKCTADMPGMKVSFDAVLPSPLEEGELAQAAEKLYAKANGFGYKNFFIMWYLPKYKIGAGAWATTTYKGAGAMPDIQFLKLQGE